MFREAKIHNRYWSEIMTTGAYLKNRTIANTQQNKTPYEIFFGKKPNVNHIKIYGSKVFVRVPEVLRKSKWDDKSQVGILTGYRNNCYRVLVNNKVLNARHVRAVENTTELICLEKRNESENSSQVSYITLENENETNNSKTIENLGTENNNVKKSYQLTSSSTLESYRNRENNFDDEELNRNLQNEERNEQIPSLERTS